MGRTAYEGIAPATTSSTDHPFADILNAGRKVVFSRALEKADWANTTIAAGDTAEEIDKLRLGGDGHIVVWGGVSLWRSLMRLDLIDELQLSVFPYVAGEGTRLFDGVPRSYRLDLVSSAPSAAGSSSCSTVATANPATLRSTGHAPFAFFRVSPPVALAIDVLARSLAEIGRADDEDLEAFRAQLRSLATYRAGRAPRPIP